MFAEILAQSSAVIWELSSPLPSALLPFFPLPCLLVPFSSFPSPSLTPSHLFGMLLKPEYIWGINNSLLKTRPQNDLPPAALALESKLCGSSV